MKFRIASAATILLLVDAPASAVDLSKTVQHVENACKLPKGTVVVVGDEVHFTPRAGETYDSVDCALKMLKTNHVEKLGFVGNERYDH